MKKLTLFFVLLITSLLMNSCWKHFVQKDEIAQRESMRTNLMEMFPSKFTIHIKSFKNLSGVAELDYAENAISGVIYSYLRPIEYEKIYVPYSLFTVSMSNLSSDVLMKLTATNSIYTNYLTNVPLAITQKNVQFMTNMELLIHTNSNMVEIYPEIPRGQKAKPVKPKQEWKYEVSSNQSMVISTNETITNIIHTNINQMTEELFNKLIVNEFPEITNTVTQIPIEIINDWEQTNAVNAANTNTNTNINSVPSTPVTNMISNLTNSILSNSQLSNNFQRMKNAVLTAEISGIYKVAVKRNGPNILDVNLHIFKSVFETNQMDLKKQMREDLVSEGVYDFMKAIRKLILNKPTGDGYIHSDPEDVNIYMDGAYIGRSPLYFPAIPSGKHQFSFLKEGYQQVAVQADIVTNITNVIVKAIQKLNTGGTVSIKSDPSNSSVFIDSIFVGNTPLELSNLTLELEHRVKIMSLTTNLQPFYHVFKIYSSNDNYTINATLPQLEGTSPTMKSILWGATFASWATTLGVIGANIYLDYQYQYFADKDATVGGFSSEVTNSLAYKNTAWYAFYISSLLSLSMTAIALYNEEVYLGLQFYPTKGIYASVGMSF